MKLVFKESNHNDWEEVAYETLYIGDDRLHLPIYGKFFGNNDAVHITPEEEDGELVWTIYHSPDFGNTGFKFVETGFLTSEEAIDYVYSSVLKRFGLSERNRIKEAYDSKARYEIAKNIASWAFGSPNMNDIDDNIDFLVNRFMKGSTLVDRMYMCDTYEELADVLSNCSLKLLMTIERGLCIDEDSISCETDYIKKMYGESRKRLREQDVEIEVKHEGILEVPEGKNVDDLPVSHFVNLAKKKGLSKITKALNNLQVWNKNDDPKLSKWAGNMIDKVSKKMEKNESISVNMFNEGWHNGDAVISFTHNDDLEADLEEFLFDLFSDNPDVFDFDWSGKNTTLYLTCNEDDYKYIKWFIKDWKYKHRDEYDEYDESFSNGRTIRESAAEKDLYDDLYSYADQYRMTSRWTKANVEKYLERQKNFRRMSDADFQKVVDKVNKDFKRKKKVKSFPYDSNSYKTESIRRKRLKEDSWDDFVKPNIEKRYIWPLYEDSAYEITEIIKKYQNSNRFKDEIKSFDFKDIEYRDWPALQLELVCSNEAYVLIRKDIEREGLYMDDDEFDESLKLKESGIYDYYDTPDNEYATFMGDIIPEEEPDKSYKHSLKVPEFIIEEFAEFVADYFNEDFNDIVNNESNNVWMDDFDSENKYIIIMCSDDEFDDIENWVNEKSLRTKNESYPRYKKSYWKYRLDHPFIDRIEDSETAIFTDSNIRNIPLLACENPDDCYSDNPLYWAVEDADYNGNPLYCTEDKAYKRLKDYLNMKIYERRHDL
ncbi:MAG: hypothetical protein J6V44_15340 [Methanobrevibacter sp.]|nr:hypothetical protein [Methanobrevibacter sp.]MBO7694588.1 hypothetical protein [Methanobrevibacter sp.]